MIGSAAYAALLAASRGVMLHEAFLGAPGVAYDFTGASGLWQDAAATVPVTASGQPVRRVLDRSRLTGTNDLLAPTDARRGTWATMPNGLPCLAFNGTSTAYATAAAVNPGANDEVHIWAAVRTLLFGTRMICESSTDSAAGSGRYVLTTDGSSRYFFYSRGTAASSATSGSYAAPDSSLLYGRGKIGLDQLTLNRNGVQVATSSTDQGTGNYTSQILNVGARNAASPSLFYNGQIARLVVLYGPISAQQKTTIDGLVLRGFATS